MRRVNSTHMAQDGDKFAVSREHSNESSDSIQCWENFLSS
jgi:hypothetical protein